MIIITGASKGIGNYLTKRFIEEGEFVYGTYNNTLPQDIGKDILTKVDVSDYNSVEEWISQLSPKEKLVLINCAGINYNCFAHKCDIDKWVEVINTNLVGSFNTIRALLPYMRQESFGRIINFSSIVAQTGAMGASAYGASKAGLWGLTKSLAKENGNKNITINNLNIGYFNIGIISEVPEDYQDYLKTQIPSAKFGDPEEIFKVVKYLIDSEYVNGTSIDINGGLY